MITERLLPGRMQSAVAMDRFALASLVLRPLQEEARVRRNGSVSVPVHPGGLVPSHLPLFPLLFSVPIRPLLHEVHVKLLIHMAGVNDFSQRNYSCCFFVSERTVVGVWRVFTFLSTLKSPLLSWAFMPSSSSKQALEREEEVSFEDEYCFHQFGCLVITSFASAGFRVDGKNLAVNKHKIRFDFYEILSSIHDDGDKQELCGRPSIFMHACCPLPPFPHPPGPLRFL